MSADVTRLPHRANVVLPEQAERYLHQFRWSLRPLPDDERQSIVNEIRVHLAEQAALGPASLQRLLGRLGPPHLLARGFVENFELAETINQANPARLLLVVLTRASRSVVALAAAILAMMAYLISAGLLITASLKPVVPTLVGAWRTSSGGFLLGVSDSRVQGHELLGYWFIPVGIILAVLCFLLGNLLLRATGRRLIKRAGSQGIFGVDQ